LPPQTAEEASKVVLLFKVVEDLDERHLVYETRNAEKGRRITLQIDPRLARANQVLYDDKPLTPY